MMAAVTRKPALHCNPQAAVVIQLIWVSHILTLSILVHSANGARNSYLRSKNVLEARALCSSAPCGILPCVLTLCLLLCFRALFKKKNEAGLGRT